MGKYEKVIMSLSLIWALAFIVISHLNIQLGLSGGSQIMDSDQYQIFWWLSLVIILSGALICVRDIKIRFKEKEERNKWYLLFLLVGSLAYPYYFFKYAIKPRGESRVSEIGKA